MDDPEIIYTDDYNDEDFGPFDHDPPSDDHYNYRTWRADWVKALLWQGWSAGEAAIITRTTKPYVFYIAKKTGAPTNPPLCMDRKKEIADLIDYLAATKGHRKTVKALTKLLHRGDIRHIYEDARGLPTTKLSPHITLTKDPT